MTGRGKQSNGDTDTFLIAVGRGLEGVVVVVTQSGRPVATR